MIPVMKLTAVMAVMEKKRRRRNTGVMMLVLSGSSSNLKTHRNNHCLRNKSDANKFGENQKTRGVYLLFQESGAV